MGVEVGKMIAPTGVKVDSGVNVLGGVAVKVAVDVNTGPAAAVCVDAASAVCMIKVLIALGSSGAMGAGVATDGTHAMINANVVNQSHNFFLGDCMLSIQGRLGCCGCWRFRWCF